VSSGTVTDTTFAVPASVLAADAATLRYVVTAVRPDGGEVGSGTRPVVP
jgi:hypothetical protein